jgi:hypothetical protein
MTHATTPALSHGPRGTRMTGGKKVSTSREKAALCSRARRQQPQLSRLSCGTACALSHHAGTAGGREKSSALRAAPAQHNLRVLCDTTHEALNDHSTSPFSVEQHQNSRVSAGLFVVARPVFAMSVSRGRCRENRGNIGAPRFCPTHPRLTRGRMGPPD